MNTAIETNNLVKRYGDVTAVDGLSLRVAKGEIYAFLGLNGAGKTTTIRV
ncbi:MAG: ATP-binding cassette domain-containing protein [Anaerolineales bacterium]|nr:ATP-binding cassette domain-containing protein [Anaerolineales bacterium]